MDKELQDSIIDDLEEALDEALERYKKYLARSTLKRNTQIEYGKQAGEFVAFLKGERTRG